MYTLKLLTVENIIDEAPVIKETLNKAMVECQIPGWTGTDVLQYSISDPINHHIWAAIDPISELPVAYCASRTFNYPTGVKEINILGLANIYAGNENISQYYVPLMEELSVQAKAFGFNKIGIVGRKGWVKVMEPYGFTVDCITLSKNLGDEDE